MMNELASVERDLESAFNMAESLRSSLQAGDMPDAEELSTLVQTVCVGAIKLPRDDALHVRSRLGELLDLLQSVKAEIVDLEQEIAQQPAPAGG